ncbi:MAG: CBU_0592 family membrane protein [Bacteroidota bacterium]
MDYLIDVIGWIGSIEVLIAYGLNSYQKLRSDSLAFYLLNLTGGLFLVVYTIYKGAFASAFVNVVWVIIAVIAIAKLTSDKTSKAERK